MTHLHLPRGCHLEDVTRCSKTSCCGPASSRRVAQRCPSDGNWVAWTAQAAPDPHPSAPRGWPLAPRLPCFGQCVFMPSESSCREFPFRFTTLPRLFFLTPTAKRNGSSSFLVGLELNHINYSFGIESQAGPLHSILGREWRRIKAYFTFSKKMPPRISFLMTLIFLLWVSSGIIIPFMWKKSTLALLTEILQSCCLKSRRQLGNQMLGERTLLYSSGFEHSWLRANQ